MNASRSRDGLIGGWPFLVGRTVHHGHRAMVVPQPYLEAGLHHLLEDAVGAEESQHPGGAWAAWAYELPDHPLLLMRSFLAADPQRPGQVLCDEHSRPIRLYAGLAISEFPDAAVPGPELIKALKARGSDAFYRAVAEETHEEPMAPEPSFALPLKVTTVRYRVTDESLSPHAAEGTAAREAGPAPADQRPRQPMAMLQEIGRALAGRRTREDPTGGSGTRDVVWKPWAVHLVELARPTGKRALTAANLVAEANHPCCRMSGGSGRELD
ncbi:hypothetical protein ACFOSC_16835 [Streptantibioticus rubrisoli]|uniref:Uncharacterized protein n=1 Tax=Streptantibioticus rubrisoli TaxID=1387313 RepID=A0ABT1PGW4_9ACTN|nr:hypothetical protein [Streptantibioticus rubrisoli]MCQ4044606.1 hypothetical protein [Streptantibioticus rubrisoli]